MTFRNALGEWDHVPANLVFQGDDEREPVLTIAITTFRRAHLLVEALESALNQRTDLIYEVVVLDNDPNTSSLEYVLAECPDLRTRNFRYYVNAENIGMYGNINRCIPVARGKWLSILHDDDLLRQDFVEVMFAELSKYPVADGIVSREHILDQRQAIPEPISSANDRKMSARYLMELVVQGPRGWRIVARRLRQRFLGTALRREWHWRGRSSRRIGPATLFLGPVLGNGSGFVFRTDAAKEAGGFYPDEFPASDLTFYARFAARYHLRQHHEQLCRYRVAENESLKPETARQALLWIHRLQQDLIAGGHVSKRLLRFSPAIMEDWRAIYRRHWRIDISKPELEELLDMQLPEEQPDLVLRLRLLLNGI
jgi:glycosyltransferase involved in cell wall biosynthesis